MLPSQGTFNFQCTNFRLSNGNLAYEFLIADESSSSILIFLLFLINLICISKSLKNPETFKKKKMSQLHILFQAEFFEVLNKQPFFFLCLWTLYTSIFLEGVLTQSSTYTSTRFHICFYLNQFLPKSKTVWLLSITSFRRMVMLWV